MDLYLVKYTGQFGFIKPWTAVRDEEVFSQQFLSPSMIAGIERKIFPELLTADWGIYKVKRYRLSYSGIDIQQEQTQGRGWNTTGKAYIGNEDIPKGKKLFVRPYSILKRGVMLNPVLYLAFDNLVDAKQAANQHICMARNEDILMPNSEITHCKEDTFDAQNGDYQGFELVFEQSDNSFMVGYNRYDNMQPMYGWLNVVGSPINNM